MPTEYAVQVVVNPETGQFTGHYQVPANAEIRIVVEAAPGVGAEPVAARSSTDALAFKRIVKVFDVSGQPGMVGAARTDVIFTSVKEGRASVTIDTANMSGPQDSIQVNLEVGPAYE